MRNVFKMKKLSKSRDKNLLSDKFGRPEDDQTEDNDGVSVDCFNSWMIQFFVKVFD